MRHIVIGTAGHIDHGKSSLVKMLTGTDPDRLKEEKERQMTIDLGFAFMGDHITFIDVPGHEKFVKTMAAGISTIDLVLLVIAADDGIMPQTLEHFEILQLLGIQKGIVVLTKIDLVEPEWRELVVEEIQSLVKGTFLENAPICPISNLTGEGIENLKDKINIIISTLSPRTDRGIFRLWIDRVFTIKGSGTVVAGTVLSGTCKTGDTVELLPQQQKVRVRRVQVHNKSIEKCVAGERAAINLMTIEKSEVNRGDMLALPDYFQPTYMLNARFNFLRSNETPLLNRTRVRLHLGTAEIICRIILLEKNELLPGESTFVQFRLEAPTAAEVGERYVIRSFSPMRTIGGGTIVEVHPQKLKWLPESEFDRLTLLEQANPMDLVEQHLLKSPDQLFSATNLAKVMSFTREQIQEVLENLVQSNRLVVLQQNPEWLVIHRQPYVRSQEQIIEYLKKFHTENPMLWGVKKSELSERLFGKISLNFLDAVLEPLLSTQQIKFRGETILLSDHQIRFSPTQLEIKKKIEALYLKQQFVTVGWDEITSEISGRPKDILDTLTGLIELGILIEIKYYEKPAIFHRDCIEAARKILVKYLLEHKEIRLGEFREMIQSTRKFATPILIYFDRLGLTEREDELRRLSPTAPEELLKI